MIRHDLGMCLYSSDTFFFSIWVFFHEYSRSTGQQGKGEGSYLTPLYHFHPLHGHLDISRAITAESSPLHIAGSRTRTGLPANHQARLSWVMFLLKSLQFIVRPFSLRYGEREFEGNLMRGLYFMQNKFSCFSRLVKIHME